MEHTINNIKLKTVDTEYDVYFDMALTMLEEIIEHNKANEQTVMIVPVGPTQQYPILAEMVNRLNVSLKNVHFFNMDEYMLSPDRMMDENDTMSFKYRMNKEFYERVRPDLVMDEDHRHFPEVGKEAEYDRLIEELGGVDYCFGGLGINGHVAFNEPPEADEPKTADEFAELGTRVLQVSRETKTINGFGYLRGDIKGMPEWCITVGMKQILASRKIYIALNRPWQNGPFKHALNDPETAEIPATLLRRVKHLTYCATQEIVG
ncbi:MAG: glucosamine-6-phosphate isomerase [Clostridia bacterium]|nr:glucosamine-6-phosphate isomerase [Clostridia bacterium]